MPEFPYGKPMVWKAPKAARRAMVGSILKAAQDAEDKGEDGDAAARKEAHRYAGAPRGDSSVLQSVSVEAITDVSRDTHPLFERP